VTMRLPFWKVQAIGNDFVLVHLADVEPILERTAAEARLAATTKAGCGSPEPGAYSLDLALSRLAISVCERRFGIGGDGLLVVWREGLDLHLRMFNPDGSEDFCGNGLRCAAAHASQIGWARSPFRIHHLGRTVVSELLADGSIRQLLGSALWRAEQVPLAPEAQGEVFEREIRLAGGAAYLASALSTGSTHTVLFVDSLPGDEEFLSASPEIEHHAWFPERTSVIWTLVEEDGALRVRIWERGVGETLGCGTGSAAAATAHCRRRGKGGRVLVHNPGGDLVVEVDDETGLLHTEGPAQTVFHGEFLWG
jgi:diaminopimelate epimerase